MHCTLSRRGFLDGLLTAALGLVGIRRTAGAHPATATAPAHPLASGSATASGNITTYSYDGCGRLAPVGCVTSYVYDRGGKLRRVITSPSPAAAASDDSAAGHPPPGAEAWQE